MFSMNRFESTSAMQTPFPPANATLVHIPPLGLFLWKPTPCRLDLVPFSPRSTAGVKAALLCVLRPAVTGRRASNEEVPVTRLIPDYDGIP